MNNNDHFTLNNFTPNNFTPNDLTPDDLTPNNFTPNDFTPDGFNLNDEVFKIAALNIIKEESESLSDILNPLKHQEKWDANAEFLIGMKRLMESLCHRLAHRASLFGQYRNDHTYKVQNGKRARPMECKESDFSLAWQTLEQDSK